MARCSVAHGWRLVLVVVLLAAMSLSPLAVSEESEAAPGAQLGTVGTALAAVCGSGPQALACAAAGAASIEAYCYYSTGSLCSVSDLLEAVEGFESLWTDEAWFTAKTEFVNQYGQHSEYFVITQEMLNAWWDVYAEWQGEGFTFNEDRNGEQVYELQLSSGMITATSAPALSFPAQTSGCGSISLIVNYLGQATSPGIADFEIQVVDASEDVAYARDYSGGAQTGWLENTVSVPAGVRDALCGTGGYRVRVIWPNSTNSPRVSSDLAVMRTLEFVDFRVVPADSQSEDVTIHQWYQAGDFMEVAAVQPAPGDRFNVVANVDDVVDWDTTSPLPLTTGVSGEVVGEAPASGATDDPGFWEGLFDGVKGAINRGTDVLGTIATGVADLLDAVQALPETLVGAIAAALVPTAGLGEQTDGLREAFDTHAPFSYATASYAALDGWFEGGTDCPSLTMPANPYGYEEHVYELCPPEGVASLSRGLSRLLAAFMLFLWSMSVVESFIGGTSRGGGGGGGGQEHGWSW